MRREEGRRIGREGGRQEEGREEEKRENNKTSQQTESGPQFPRSYSFPWHIYSCVEGSLTLTKYPQYACPKQGQSSL